MRWPQLPDYGYIDRWPEDGIQFIGEGDEFPARRCIPSGHIFRRNSFDGEFYSCSYGELRFRVRPCLWQPVRTDGFDIGDTVETVGTGMRTELFIAQIATMEFHRASQSIQYGLRNRSAILPRKFTAVEIRLVHPKARLRS